MILITLAHLMAVYPVPATETEREIKVSNSRFIAALAPAFSVEEARAFIQRRRQQLPDASHHAPAFVIGHGVQVIAHCHDDGEPAGSAGQPILAVLRGSGLGDAVVVVTRYFGGTKLGIGGLVRAYGDAARAVIAVGRRAYRVPTHLVRLVLPYSYLERVRLVLADHGGEIVEESFAADITLTARLAEERFPVFQRRLQEMSRGVLSAAVLTTEMRLIPVEPAG